MAHALNARVFLPDYRLAPEHPFPAATDDAFNVYRELIADPRPVVIAGDSAGGNLTLVTLLRARDQLLKMPACALAISPASDARGTLMSRQANSDSDTMLSHGMIEVATDIYLAGADPAHPYASPITADFTGLPPLLFTVSSEECLRDDTHAAAQCARDAGVPVQVLERDDMPHVWPVFTFLLPEAKQDFPTIVRILGKYLTSNNVGKAPSQTVNASDSAIVEVAS